MIKDNTRMVVSFGFLAVLGAMAFSAFFAMHQVNLAQREVNAGIDNINTPVGASRKLRTALVERHEVLRRMLATDDDLQRAELQAELLVLSGEYMTARDLLEASELDPQGTRIVMQLGEVLDQLETRFDRTLADMEAGMNTARLRSHTARLGNLQSEVNDLVGQFIELRRTHVSAESALNGAVHQKARNAIVLVSVACILLALGTGLYVLWRTIERTRSLAYQASHDPLTTLINRSEFQARVNRALESVRRYGHEYALIMFDLDRFKVVNDSCGHAAGDRLLKLLATRLCRHMRQRDSLARLGGDEFAVLLDNCPLDMAVEKARGLIADIEGLGFAWRGNRFDISAGLGLTMLCRNDTAESAVSRADAACYRAKQRAPGEIEVAESGQRCPRYDECTVDLRPSGLRLLKEERYELYCQPICRSDSGVEGGVRYAEVLLRCRDADGNLVLPGSFIPDAERYGLIQEIDKWVVQHTLRWLADTGSTRAPLKLSINLSGRSICDGRMTDFILEQFEINRVDPHDIVFEITETAAISGLDLTIRNMEIISGIGCAFSLDDFGSGLSSFSYLKNLPVDYLKIDGEFVREISADHRNCSIVRLFNDIGHTLGKHTVAEYVEDEETRSMLREIGVDFLQGNAIGEPRALELLRAS